MDTTDLIIVALFMGGFVLFALAMLGVALRWGPRRGTWNQPAAAFVAPTRWLLVSMYVFALAHVAAGIIVAAKVPGAGLAGLLVLTAMGVFYVLGAHSAALASTVTRRRRSEPRAD